MHFSNFILLVEQGRNQSQIINRKSIWRNTTHRQTLHLIETETSFYIFFTCIF